jgi:hypothetical protein
MSDVNSLNLLINIQDANKAGLVSDFSSRVPATLPFLIQNDVIGVSLRFLQPATTGAAWTDINYSTAVVTMGIGEASAFPQSGTFTLTYGANTTSALAYNVSASAVASALNALASITSAGGVTVTSPKTGAYVITFSSAGVRTAISGTSSLFPNTSIVDSEVVAGTVSVPEVQIIQLVVNPYCLNTTWAQFSSAAAQVAVIAAGSGSTQNVQSITLDPVPYGGTFQITTSLLTTAAIPYNATAQQVQDALGGSANYTVSGNTGGPWTITKTANGSVATHTVNVSGLLVPIGLTGELNLSTYALYNRFLNDTADTITLTLEIQVNPDGTNPATVLQVPINITKDVINYSNLVPSPVTSYPTTADVTAAVNTAKFITISGNKTAVSGEKYLNVASATYTDPTPATGANYQVLVRNGTATIGGTAFSYVTNRPILVIRSYHSGAWVNQVFIGTSATGVFLDSSGSNSLSLDGRTLINDLNTILSWNVVDAPPVVYITGINGGEVQGYKNSTSTATSGTDAPTATYGDSNMSNLAASLAATLTLDITSWATAAWPGSRLTYFSRSGVTGLTFTATGFTIRGASLTTLAALASVEYLKADATTLVRLR